MQVPKYLTGSIVNLVDPPSATPIRGLPFSHSFHGPFCFSPDSVYGRERTKIIKPTMLVFESSVNFPEM